MDSKFSFISGSEEFFIRNRGSVVFRMLKYFTKATDRELGMLIKKIYSSSMESSQQIREGRLKTYLGLPLLPFYILFAKKVVWQRGAESRFNLETPDEEYFRTRYARLFSLLDGTKRITPRHRTASISGHDTTEPSASSVTAMTLIRLFLISPAVTAPLYIFCLLKGVNILREYRHALNLYATFEGYIRRYPCRDYITYEDHSNHPARYIAFRQSSGKRFIAVQNGERGPQPVWAFGMVDIYFVFGDYYSGLLRRLGYHAGQVVPAGSLTLNMHYETLMATASEPLYDIIYIDNGSLAPPDYGGLREDAARSEEVTLKHLNTLKSRHKGLKVAYQLRPYAGDTDKKARIAAAVRRILTEDIGILENSGSGESYVNIRRARLVVCFQSTMGYEALRMGAKCLFVNCSGYPSETLCEDGRFQIEDENLSYGGFEEKALSLMEMKLDGVPDAALKRHAVFNGRVQEAVAEAINSLKGQDVS